METAGASCHVSATETVIPGSVKGPLGLLSACKPLLTSFFSLAGSEARLTVKISYNLGENLIYRCKVYNLHKF